ncbi:MAG: non-canonical purine NTP pyrophosphatase [Candidatus Woesearchaeota archaeon]
MKKIILATTNYGKVNTIKTALSEYNIKLKHVKLNLPEPKSYNLKEITKAKVVFAFNHIKKPCIAIDSGFYIHSINGFPKTFVNFALNTIGIDGILKLVKGKKRNCEFRNCLAYIDETLKEPIYFESKTKGILLKKPRKQKRLLWGKLHSIFVPDGFLKTLSEMNKDELNEYESKKNKKNFAKKFAKWISQKQ